MLWRGAPAQAACAEAVAKEDEEEVPVMSYATAVPQGFGEEDGVTAWLGPERAPPLPLPELVTEDEACNPAYAAWLAACPLPPRWVKNEREFLEVVRAECGEELAKAPPYPEAYGDRRLLRFLRQHKRPDKALAAVKQYLAYRRDNGLDEIRAFIADGHVPQSGWPLGDFFSDRCCVCPCSTALFDVKGNPLCVEQYGFWPAHRLRDVTAEGYIAWQTYALEFKSMQLERVALGRERVLLRAAHAQWEARRGNAAGAPSGGCLREGWGEVARLCTIFDMKGLTFAHALLPGGFRMVKQLIPLVQRYYPWLQDTTHFVNASMAVSTFFAYLRPLLPKHTQRKIFIHGSGAAASLTEEIRPDFLPIALGGRAECLDLTPPPTVDEYDARVARGAAALALTAVAATPALDTDQDGVVASAVLLGPLDGTMDAPPPESRDDATPARAKAPRDDDDDDVGPEAAAAAPKKAADDDAPPRAEPEPHDADGPPPPPRRQRPGTIPSGIEIPVHKHGRRGRAERSLRLDDRKEIQILPAKRWRFLKRTRRLPLAPPRGAAAGDAADDAAIAAFRGSRTHGAKPVDDERPRTQLQRDAALRASQYPPNFVVIATPKHKLVTLELATEGQAEALVHAIRPQRA